ncbi:uncharacterized protein LOC128710989 [Anopheles marshallii]|uniref:uncharacterized protein LOC128710989 n=1 Tax=Anopheles marshallii TaxID=1521116 RepID=UPI00237A1010|nr:uncharacterized protein LOC128710989 [Anopheles marshallii]
MSREKVKPKRQGEPKNLKAGSILADDQECAKRYIEWKNLMDKYNQPEDDDDSMSIDDALDLYGKNDNDEKRTQTVPEALECSEDDEDKENSESDYAALKNQLTTALQRRSTEWKNNGMAKIFNSNFSLSVDYVQRWLENCADGTGKQVTQERATHFTDCDGETQVNVTQRENISILNHTDRKQLASEHSSNYELCGTDQRRVIVQQVEKTTISSFCVVDPRDSNGTGGPISKLPLDSCFANLSTFMPFKIKSLNETLGPLSCEKERVGSQLHRGRTFNSSSLNSGSLISLIENSLQIVPKARIESDLKKKPVKANPKRRVHFKPARKVRQIISDSSESSNLDEDFTSDDDDDTDECPARVSKPMRTVPARMINKIPVMSLCSDSSDDSQCETNAVKPQPSVPSLPADTTIKRLHETGAPLTNGFNHLGNGNKKPPKDQQQQQLMHKENERKYQMPANYRQMLSVNGRCPYKSDGIVIYRPKPIHAGLPRNADRILIKNEDLDLSGIESKLRRKKFDNFSCQSHPNSVLVYYMSDSDHEPYDELPVRNANEDSSDDDDPISNYKTKPCILTYFNEDP